MLHRNKTISITSLIAGDEIRIYYTGYRGRHWAWARKKYHNDMIKKNNLDKLKKDDPNFSEGLITESDDFLLEAEYRFNQSRTVMYSTLSRNDKGEVTVKSRSQGTY